MLLWEDSKRTASIYPAAFRKSKYISLFGWLYILGPSESKEAKNYHPFVQSCLLPPFWCFFMSTISSKRISYRELPYPTPTWKASWHGLCCLERKIWIQFSKHPCSVHHLNCQQNNQIYFQRSFYPEIIQTSSSTFGYIPSTEEQMKQRLQIPSTTLQPPPPQKKKIIIIKALKPFLGRGHLIPNESLFWCQVSRVHPHDFHYRQPEKPCFQRAPVGWNSGSTNAFEPRGFLGSMFPNWGEENDGEIGRMITELGRVFTSTH